jgi:phosphoribosylformylglycinamidine synthase PurS subunit
MKYIAEIDIMPLKSLLDPQGKAVSHGLINMGLAEIENVRIGKHITLEINSTTKEDASGKVDEACRKLLSNPIMESFHFEIFEMSESLK